MRRAPEEYGGQADIKLDVVFGKLFLYVSELSSRVHILQKELSPHGNTVSIKGFICSATKLRQVVRLGVNRPQDLASPSSPVSHRTTSIHPSSINLRIFTYIPPYIPTYLCIYLYSYPLTYLPIYLSPYPPTSPDPSIILSTCPFHFNFTKCSRSIQFYAL